MKKGIEPCIAEKIVVRHAKILRTMSSFAPGRSVFQDPIDQGTFKIDVAASFLALDPFVTKDLFAFSQESGKARAREAAPVAFGVLLTE